MTDPHYRDESVVLYHGDCIDVLRDLDDASIDAVCTDPPYALEFMGAAWDRHPTPRAFQQWCKDWARECFRVLKPGGHLLAFGGSRTAHRLACGIEDAGFEIRDEIVWLYGSGFPKSLDIAKAVDSALGVDTGADERWVATPHAITGAMKTASGNSELVGQATPGERHLYDPATDDAQRWSGWGTALKPAHEPIVVARKPVIGTVAANVLAHGTGGINIDATRIGWGEEGDRSAARKAQGYSEAAKKAMGGVVASESATGFSGEVVGTNASAGRWPPNVVLDDAMAGLLDEQTGELASGEPGIMRLGENRGAAYGAESRPPGTPMTGYGDRGGASRYFPVFRYEAKAPGDQRPRYWLQACDCEDSWPTRITSPARATDGTTAPESSSTSKSGSEHTAPSPPDTSSTTSMRTSSTTSSATSDCSPTSSTSDSTLATSSETACGGSDAGPAVSSSRSTATTGTTPASGRTLPAGPAASQMPWHESSVCGKCGTPARSESHATVKPVDLMRWLVRLVCPPGGTVLEPFAGSGTTAEACVIEGMRCIAIERHAPYLPLIVARLSKPIQIDLLAQLGGSPPAPRDLREPSAERTYKHEGAVEFTGKPGPRWDAKPKKEEQTEPML